MNGKESYSPLAKPIFYGFREIPTGLSWSKVKVPVRLGWDIRESPNEW